MGVKKPINPLTPNDLYRGRTAPLTSKHGVLYIYSTNIGTEYFKHGIYSVFSLQNAVRFIILTYLVLVLFTFYIQCVLKLKKIIPAPKGYEILLLTQCFIQYFLLQTMLDIQENSLLYSETFINTVCMSIQFSAQKKICERFTFL